MPPCKNIHVKKYFALVTILFVIMGKLSICMQSCEEVNVGPHSFIHSFIFNNDCFLKCDDEAGGRSMRSWATKSGVGCEHATQPEPTIRAK